MASERLTNYIQENKKVLLADISLVFVALFWGANFVIAKDALEHISPFAYLGIRFLLGTFILGGIFWRRLVRIGVRDVKCGLLLGSLLFFGFATQTVGLVYTTPAKSGFITGISVVMVPFVYYLVTRNNPGIWAFIGGVLATVGLYFLSFNDSFAQGQFALQYGDGLTLICAVFYAIHIVTLGVLAPKRDPITLAVLQLAVVGIASTLVSYFFESPVGLTAYSLNIWGAILFAVIFCTIGAFVTMTTAQQHTHSTHAALILCLEAAFAGLFSYLFWGEFFTLSMLFGIVLIFTGIIVTVLKPNFSKLKLEIGGIYRQR